MINGETPNVTQYLEPAEEARNIQAGWQVLENDIAQESDLAISMENWLSKPSTTTNCTYEPQTITNLLFELETQAYDIAHTNYKYSAVELGLPPSTWYGLSDEQRFVLINKVKCKAAECGSWSATKQAMNLKQHKAFLRKQLAATVHTTVKSIYGLKQHRIMHKFAMKYNFRHAKRASHLLNKKILRKFMTERPSPRFLNVETIDSVATMYSKGNSSPDITTYTALQSHPKLQHLKCMFDKKVFGVKRPLESFICKALCGSANLCKQLVGFPNKCKHPHKHCIAIPHECNACEASRES